MSDIKRRYLDKRYTKSSYRYDAEEAILDQVLNEDCFGHSKSRPLEDQIKELAKILGAIVDKADIDLSEVLDNFQPIVGTKFK